LIALAIGIHAQSAHAYLDPGTGSLMVQMAIGAIAAAGAALSVYKQRIRDYFRRSPNKGAPTASSMAKQEVRSGEHGTID
jgi:hypothetical protein